MQSEYFKIKAKKIAKQTWAGPGKFGVFIVICIIIIATFESLGLSNREKNLEMRTIPLVSINMNLKNIEEKPEINTSDIVNYSVSSYREKNNSESIKLQEEMLLFAAVDQLEYEGDINFSNIYTESMYQTQDQPSSNSNNFKGEIFDF